VTKYIIKRLSDKKITNSILIEGLPGIGNVARLTVDYLIDKLKAEKILELYSDAFPNSVTINDDSTIKMFNLEFFYVKIKEKDLVLVSGDVQPTNDADSYSLCNKMLVIAKELGVTELITIGGIGLPEPPDESRIHSVVNDESMKEKIKDLGLIFDGNETVKIILGVSGLLLGMAGLNKLKGFSLLAETLNDPQYAGIKESKELLKTITKYLQFDIDFSELDEEIKSYEEEIKRESSFNYELNDSYKKHGYIG